MNEPIIIDPQQSDPDSGGPPSDDAVVATPTPEPESQPEVWPAPELIGRVKTALDDLLLSNGSTIGDWRMATADLFGVPETAVSIRTIKGLEMFWLVITQPDAALVPDGKDRFFISFLGTRHTSKEEVDRIMRASAFSIISERVAGEPLSTFKGYLLPNNM